MVQEKKIFTRSKDYFKETNLKLPLAKKESMSVLSNQAD
jgi:hypothetical protein